MIKLGHNKAPKETTMGQSHFKLKRSQIDTVDYCIVNN